METENNSNKTTDFQGHKELSCYLWDKTFIKAPPWIFLKAFKTENLNIFITNTFLYQIVLVKKFSLTQEILMQKKFLCKILQKKMPKLSKYKFHTNY